MFDRRASLSEHDPAGPSAALDQAFGAGPTPLGRRAFIAGVAGAAAATAVGATADAAAPAGASYYEPIDQFRLADTRPGEGDKNFRRISDRVIRIQVAGRNGIPREAVAAVISIIGINNGQPGYVRAVPAGQDSEVANVILEPGDTLAANLATVKLSASGAIDIVGLRPYDVIVDISGVYIGTTAKRRGGRLKLLDQTARVAAGTFIGSGQRRTFVLNQVPANAKAVVANVTAASARAPGFLAAFPTGLATVPKISTVNFVTGEVRGAGAIIQTGLSGGRAAIDVFALGGADVYIDVSGYITGDSDVNETIDGLFVPVAPVRLLDSRRESDVRKAGGKRRLWPRWSRAFTLPSGSSGFPRASGGVVPAAGLAMNLTSVASMNPGFVTVLAAQTPRREVSNLNISRVNQTVANHVITPVSTKGVECFTLNGGHIVCDVAGWYVGAPKRSTLGKPVDPDPPAAPFNWVLNVPRMGLTNFVQPNIFSGDPVVDRGESWHWTNTGMIGESGASIVTFGHRTSRTARGNGPYRLQHFLQGNDLLNVATPDQRLYSYRFVREELTSSSALAILTAARRVAGSTFSLVACTGTRNSRNRLPQGGIRYRIVSTFALEQWADISPTIPG